ncbi:hypothetical protein [Chryseobacterium culicis]|uniref:hypothetical protein n=1 Tax=Chryseobacterium culicis TaxID=680127 RepID=UPI0028A0376C|nr:hypothetical protein [Chryseobacterium culicis]
MSFKLIAIRPLSNCNKRFLKNLKNNQLYKFYNDYTFDFNITNDKKEFVSIKYQQTIPAKLYKQGKTNINISAIVGKNGSGKSSVSELLIISLFYVANKIGLVNVEDFIYLTKKSKNESSKQYEYRKEKYYEELSRYFKEIKQIEEELNTEIYYEINEEVFQLKIDNDTSKITIKNTSSNSDEIEILNKRDIPVFFYSMIINYSSYAFNTNDIGIWLKGIFHKNDGYQMPIVINPYRIEGNYDINKETYLTRSRLLANILSIKGYSNINPKSRIKEIALKIDSEKVDNLNKLSIIKNIDTYRRNLIIPLFNMFFGKEIRYILNHENPNIFKLTEIYLINKLLIIPEKYYLFEDFKDFINSHRKTSEYLLHIYKDRSHITTKVRQAINFLRDNFYFMDSDILTEKKIDSNDISIKISKLTEEKFFTEAIDYLPPSFLISRIIFDDDSDFNQLSSGEKQKIYSLNSVVYHIKNLDSVHKNYDVNNDKNILKYENINVLLDEIELYYHPDFQKATINDLLSLIKDANFQNVFNINLIFLSHSPFILSDIPKQNVLFLENGKPITQSRLEQMNTFSANISDLISNSFFINDGMIGDYAKFKINETITWLNRFLTTKFKNEKVNYLKEEQQEHKKLINIIDDPIVKRKLSELYFEIFGENSENTEKLEKLLREKARIEIEIESLRNE